MKFDKVEMTSKSGKPFVLRVPQTQRTEPSTFIVAAHKTGSTLLNRITTELAQRGNVPHINVELDMWRQSIAIGDWPDALFDLLEQPGFVFDSFRSLQKLPQLASFAKSPKIFLVRDPRDVAVSYYFSMLKSHAPPAADGAVKDNMALSRAAAEKYPLDDYVLQDECGLTLRNMQRFCAYRRDADHSTFFRYEDIIFAKREWTAELAEMLGADVSEKVINEIADKNDIRPDKEDPNKHVRQVTPGNHKKHLSGRASAFLQAQYSRLFESFGY